MYNKHNRLFFILLSIVSVTGCSDMGPELERGDYVSYPRDIHAAWSPDGRWIVYRHEDYTKYDSTYPNGLYLIDPDGNNRRLLLRGEAALPAWSPDGQWIAYTDGAIYALNFHTGEERRLTNFTAFFPSWSPDGAKIACGRSGPQDIVGIWIIDFQDTSAIRWGFGGAPHWSPDGEKFVYSASPDPYTGPQVTVVGIFDGTSNRLTRNQYDNRRPLWSPSGLMITWTLLVKTKAEVWIMNRDGSGQRKLVDGSHPSFSPDSRAIVFSDFDSSKEQIVLWRINIDGTGLRQLTH
jgi:Tol biopolymer transport system component